jgi:hypothetical protein
VIEALRSQALTRETQWVWLARYSFLLLASLRVRE